MTVRTSAFYGRGKKTAWDTLTRNPGYSWVSLEPFSVILRGVNPKCIDDCTALEQANLAKLHTFSAQNKVNTYSENFFQSDVSVSIWSWPSLKFMTSRETQEY